MTLAPVEPSGILHDSETEEATMDRTTKFLLACIAFGLLGNLFAPILRPQIAFAQYESDYILKAIDAHLSRIDANIERLQRGDCANRKLCL